MTADKSRNWRDDAKGKFKVNSFLFKFNLSPIIDLIEIFGLKFILLKTYVLIAKSISDPNQQKSQVGESKRFNNRYSNSNYGRGVSSRSERNNGLSGRSSGGRSSNYPPRAPARPRNFSGEEYFNSDGYPNYGDPDPTFVTPVIKGITYFYSPLYNPEPFNEEMLSSYVKSQM